MRYVIFETNGPSLTHVMDAEVDDLAGAVALGSSLRHLRAYNKRAVGEEPGVLHILSPDGDIWWAGQDGAWTQLEGEDTVLAWLVGPLLSRATGELESRVEELREELDDEQREKGKLEEKISELCDGISSASGELSAVRRELESAELGGLIQADAVKEHLREQLQTAIEKMLDGLIGQISDLDQASGIIDLDSIAGDVGEIENSLDNLERNL